MRAHRRGGGEAADARGQRVEELEGRLAAIRAVDEQAEDEALWSVPLADAQPISEAHLQQELRRLHAVIEEGESGG